MQNTQPRPSIRRGSSFSLSTSLFKDLTTGLRARRLSSLGPGRGLGLESILLRLPNELLHLVTKHLDLPSVTSLRWTCRQLYQRIPARRKYSVNDLVAMESWPEYTTHLGYLAGMMPQLVSSLSFSQQRNLFACSGCLRLRPPEYFSTSMLERGYSKSFSGDASSRQSMYRNLLHQYVGSIEEATDERFSRLCIDCGISNGRYWPGSTLHFGSPYARRGSTERGVGIVCGRCGKFEDILFEDLNPGGHGGQRRTCQNCVDVVDIRGVGSLRHKIEPLIIEEEAIVDED